jgi:uncharacterized protein YlxP (DUF503 family)
MLAAVETVTVYIGVYLVRLECPWVQSLKEKRSLVKPLVEKLKHKFPVSVARLEGLDEHGWEVIGVSAISHDQVWLRGVLNRIDEVVAASACDKTETRLEIEMW